MDEIIVQISRCVACYPRLRILTLLAHESELSPTQLAQRLKMPLPQVSGHLRRLSSVGLIQRRHSGRHCYCAAKSPYAGTTISGKLSRWLFDVLRVQSNALPPASPQKNRRGAPPSEAQTHRLIFNAATIFTNQRRLQILRDLSLHGHADSPTLTTRLRMSPAALSRHTGKLVRRGVIVVRASPRERDYQLAQKLSTPIHCEFFEIVRQHWVTN